MDYEKMYKDALERAKTLANQIGGKDFAEHIFPELSESEDERIRKEIMHHISLLEYNRFMVASKEECLAYLEKLKEQEFTHHGIDESLSDAVTHQMEDDGDVDDFVRRGIDEIALKYAELGARWQKEQKSAWSEGDEKDIAHIIRVLDDCYAYGRHDLSKTDHENLTSMIKSLRPRPHWKPSEDQMEEMEFVINEYREDGCIVTANYLQEILDQIKKL